MRRTVAAFSILASVTSAALLLASDGSTHIQSVPAPPTHFAATSPVVGQVYLTWTLVPGATRYEVSQDGIVIGHALTTNDTSLLSFGLPTTVQFAWDIRACNDSGCGAWHGAVFKKADGA